jgi:hypothetical protein
MGYPAPAEEEVAVDLRYVTQRVRFPSGSVESRVGVVIGGSAQRMSAVILELFDRRTKLRSLGTSRLLLQHYQPPAI